MKAVDFTDAELAETQDFNNLSQFARDGVDQLVGGAIAYPHHWSAYTISKQSSVVLRLSPGTYFESSIVYRNEDQTDLNVQVHLPFVINDGKWIAVLARPLVNTITDQRLVLTDADTGVTVAQTVPKIADRNVQYVIQEGTESPTPLKPVIANTDCVICFVLLKTTGIDTIVPGEAWRAKTLYEVEGRVTTLEIELLEALQRIATIDTEIAWLANQLKQIPRPELMVQLQTDAAQTRRRLNMPSAARAYWYDPGLLQTAWDKTNADWLARVKTGVRFQYAQIVDNQLGLSNAGDPLVKVVNNLALPAWTEATRISVEGNDGYKDISSQVHTVTNAVQNTVSGVSIAYGPTVNVCQNTSEWGSVAGTTTGDIFNVNGSTYVSAGLSTDTTVQAGYLDSPATWNADPQSAGHQIYAVQQVQYDSWTSTYWTYETKTYGVNGSIYGQTFLNSQQCIATSVDLNFTRADNTSGGDVHLFICECDETAAPQFVNVVAQSTVAAEDVAVGWVNFPLTPTLLDAGKRYAWYTVTVGNHALATVANNKFAQGSLFWSTDGGWSQGDPLNDFAFHLNVAKFANPRTVVNFTAFSCPLGMTEVQLLYHGWAPPGTSLAWELLPSGETEWVSILKPFTPSDENPLYGLPPLAQCRATFVGTTDLMPAIVLDVSARQAAMRMRNDMTACSKVQNFGLSTTSITTITIVDNFDPVHATFTGKIKIGATLYTPDTTSTEIDPIKPLRRTITHHFTVPSTTSAVYHPSMTTDAVTSVPFIESALMVAS